MRFVFYELNLSSGSGVIGVSPCVYFMLFGNGDIIHRKAWACRLQFFSFIVKKLIVYSLSFLVIGVPEQIPIS